MTRAGTHAELREVTKAPLLNAHFPLPISPELGTCWHPVSARLHWEEMQPHPIRQHGVASAALEPKQVPQTQIT